MLRAVRLAAKLDFTIAPDARAPFDDLGDLLLQAPPARLFDESLKLFLAGNGLKSFRALDETGLLVDVFPLTARALAFRGGGAIRAMIEQGLADTDARIAADKSVTPAFLFAILLWGPVRAQVQREIDKGVEPSLAWVRVANQVIAEQAKHVAIPRRFSVTMLEIWLLQPRFEQRLRKRVFRLLAHPRFRAAYDFLVLRAGEGPEIAELGAWWTEAQTVPHDALASRLNAAAGHATAAQKADDEADAADGSTANAPAKKRRPRRKRRRDGGPVAAAETMPTE
jgi:poly(A) polymerase